MKTIIISDPMQFQHLTKLSPLRFFLNAFTTSKAHSFEILPGSKPATIKNTKYVFDNINVRLVKQKHGSGFYVRCYSGTEDEQELIATYDIKEERGRVLLCPVLDIKITEINEANVVYLKDLCKKNDLPYLNLSKKPMKLSSPNKGKEFHLVMLAQPLRNLQVMRQQVEGGSLISINNGSSLSAFFVSNQNQVTPVPSIEHTLNNDNRSDPALLASLMTLMENTDDLEYLRTSAGHFFYNQKEKKWQIIRLNYDVGFTQNAKGELILKFIDPTQSIAGDDPVAQGNFNQGVHPVVLHGICADRKVTIKPEFVKEGYLSKLFKIGELEYLLKERQLLQLLGDEYKALHVLPIPGTKLAAMYMRHFQGMTLTRFIKDVLSKVPTAQKQALQMQLAQLLSERIVDIHKKIVHRDFKADNIIITVEDNDHTKIKAVWVIDLGFADKLTDEARVCTFGSPLYCAPEVLSQLYSYRKQVQRDDAFNQTTRQQDTWSLAILLIEIFTVQNIDNYFQKFGNISQNLIDSVKGIYELSKDQLATDFSDGFREKLTDMLTQMMNLDWTQRPTSEQVLGMVNELSAIYDKDKDIALKAHQEKVVEYRGKRKSSPAFFDYQQTLGQPVHTDDRKLAATPIIPCF